MYHQVFKLFLFLIILSLSTFGAVTELDELYVLYDAGETSVLKPVIEKSIAEGRKVRVIKIATADNLISSNENFLSINDVLGTLIASESFERHDRVDPSKIESLLEKYRPTKVITGMVSSVQNQIAEAYSSFARIYGVYDSFNPVSYTHLTLPTIE